MLGRIKIEDFGFFSDQAKRHITKTLISLLKGQLGMADKIFHDKVEGLFLLLMPHATEQEMQSKLETVLQRFNE